MEAVSQNAWEGLNKELDLEKLAEPTFPIIFATFPTLINIPHLRLKHSLEKSRFRIGWSKKLNGVVFTIFMPFSFSAISLYKMDESMGSFIRNSSFKLSSVIARQVVAPESLRLSTRYPGVAARGRRQNLGTRSGRRRKPWNEVPHFLYGVFDRWGIVSYSWTSCKWSLTESLRVICMVFFLIALIPYINITFQ